MYGEKPVGATVTATVAAPTSEVPDELQAWLDADPAEWQAKELSPEYLQETIYESLKAKYRPQISVDRDTYLPIYDDTYKDVLNQILRKFDDYFAGKRKVFNIPLCPFGTDFQLQVWKSLLDIPYGETRSYMDIARTIGNPKGVRAVAQAIGANGIGILIPCHRILLRRLLARPIGPLAGRSR